MRHDHYLPAGIKGFDLYVIGHARHGKDTAAELIAELYNVKFCSSSWFMNERVVFDKLAPKYGYKTHQACFDDRHNKREEWYNIIAAENPTGTELSKRLFKEYDIYVGLRNEREMRAVMADPTINNINIWIDASTRKPLESPKSMSVPRSCAHIVLDNNAGEYRLFKQVLTLAPLPFIGYVRAPKLIARCLWRDARRKTVATDSLTMDSLEVTTNMVLGALINCSLTYLIFGITVVQALWVTALFFAIGWARSFSLRRLFRWLGQSL